MGSVEGVQLVDDEVFKRLGLVAIPQLGVLRPDEQIVEHLVVRQQDIRRVAQQCIMVGDDCLFGHGGARCMFIGRAFSDIHAGGHVVTQFRTVMDQFRDAFRLVGGERVHRIDQDRLDAGVAESAPLVAVLQNWIQEAFGLA